MKKLIALLLSLVIVTAFGVSVSAADLSEVMPNANAGTPLDGYHYDNHIYGTVIPDVLTIEFDLAVEGPINPYSTIFCFHNGDGGARFCFTLGGGMFYNNWSGSWFDAGLHEGIYENIFEPYIGSTVHVKMEFDFDQFSLYLNDEYIYGSDTLNSNLNATGAFYGENLPTDYMTISVLLVLSQKLDFGYNSWWTSETLDIPNADISDFAIYYDGNLMAKYFIGGVAGANEFHDESEYAPETESEAPETTAPETEEQDVTTAPVTETPAEEKSGCGSALTASAVILTLTVTLGTALIKKKS